MAIVALLGVVLFFALSLLDPPAAFARLLQAGTIRADEPPLVVITSNRTREVHDALKRRCLYHWIDYPSTEQAAEIVDRAKGHVVFP